MSVLQVQPTFGDNGKLAIDGSEQTRNFLVECNSVSDTPAIAASASGIPTLGTADETITGLIVQSIDAQRTSESPYVWNVAAHYSTAKPTGAGQRPDPGTNGAGLKWQAEISVDGVEVTQEAMADVDGSPIVNSFGDRFTPALAQTLYDEQVTLSYYTDSVAAATIRGLRGKLNAASITLNPPGCTLTYAAKEMKLTRAAYSLARDQTATAWKVDLVFQIRIGGWTYKMVDSGYNYSDGSAVVRGQTPVLLDGDAGKLPDDTDAVLIDFELEPTGDISGLFDGTGLVSGGS
jgi:hypothetical protein